MKICLEQQTLLVHSDQLRIMQLDVDFDCKRSCRCRLVRIQFE